MYMYHLIYPFWLFSVRSSLHKTHLNLFFPVITKTLVPHFLHTGGPYTTLPKYFSFFFVTCASPNSNVPNSHSTTNTYALFVQWTHPDTRWFHFLHSFKNCCIYKPLAFILPSKYSAGYKNLISEPWTRRLLWVWVRAINSQRSCFYYEVFYY